MTTPTHPSVTAHLCCILSLSMLALFLCGCASVKVHKVSDYDVSSGKFKGPEGFRYYLPRPYVSVYEPFILSSKAHLVSGVLSPDGQYVALDSASMPQALSDCCSIDSKWKVIPTAEVLVATKSTGRLQSEDDEPAPKTENETVKILELLTDLENGKVSTEEDDKEDEDDEDQTTENSSNDSGEGGILELQVSNDNNAIAVTPARRFFDIVFLPDFDEQYVLTTKGIMGNAWTKLTYGQGWSLQSLKARVDNSAVAERIFNLYDNSIQLLMQYAAGQIGISLPSGLTDSDGNLQSAGGGKLAEAVIENKVEVGTRLTMKIHVVRMAAPGLYPILKPSELKQFTADIIAKLKAGQQLFGGYQDLSIPVPPFTNIAFNAYEVVVAEALVPKGDSPLNFARYTTVHPSVNPYTGTTPPVTDANRSAAELLSAASKKVIEVITDEAIKKNITSIGLAWSEADKEIQADVTVKQQPVDAAAKQNIEDAVRAAIHNILNTDDTLKTYRDVTDDKIVIELIQ